MRDNFTLSTKRIVAERVNYICSNPDCEAQTIGPRSDNDKSINVGVAAHIHAASENGPRYSNYMTHEDRKHINNAIWLCQTCSKLIDSDTNKYTVHLLNRWKKDAEEKAFLNIGRTRNGEKSAFKILIRNQYRKKILFSVISSGSNHWIVNRLYLKYISEYEYDLQRWFTEAPLFQINYSITLSRKYSEYDLIPLTPDQEIHGFQYKGTDSDHFRIIVHGTDVSIVQICADISDVNNNENKVVKSEEIKIVGNSSLIPKWDKPIPVEDNQLIDNLRPLSYKAISHLNYDDFLRNLDRFHLIKIKNDLSSFNSRLKSTIDNSKYYSSSGFDRFETLFQIIKIYIQDGSMWLPSFLKELLYGKYSSSEYALYHHIKEVITEINSILR